MDLQGTLVDTNLRIYPSANLLNYIKSLPINDDVPVNIGKFVKGKDYEPKQKVNKVNTEKIPIHLNSKDIENLNKIKAIVNIQYDEVEEIEKTSEEETNEKSSESKVSKDKKESKKQKDSNDKPNGTIPEKKKSKEVCNDKTKTENGEKEEDLHLTTSDIDWLYDHLQALRNKGDGDKKIPYLHELLEGSQIGTPNNEVIKRNPVLEARCVKLRAQQEARDYRKMTKSVDNVRMRFPEDSISYQLKQVNRQLIAIGQFIISIFAGFLFGFKGVEWMIGHLDFGFRLLLGVMCALIIALAEIYFLAKKLNEELNIPETVQLGGPPKFVDERLNPPKVPTNAIEKEHQE